MRQLLEREAENFFEKQGFDVVKRCVVKNKKELQKVKLRFPLVVKVISKKIVHKAKSGGVVLGVKNIEELKKSFDKLMKLSGAEGLMIQEMFAERFQSIIIGLKNTSEFGLVIMVGAGGGKVEEKKDVSFRMVPIRKKDVLDMIKDLKIDVWNKKLVVKNLLKMNKIAKKYPNIQEVDINPLAVIKNKAVVLDARIEVK